jgi:thiamine pyrophosphate-dependent acetolactate synthase large subunit-like protein
MPKANGGEIVADTLRVMGVTRSFGIVSSSLAEVTDLLPEAGIEYYGVRHEQWAGHMADAYARVLGKPAVVLLQMGAGLTNMVTSAATAKSANSPMIIISGSAVSKQALRGTYQETDQVAIMRPVTKYSERVPRADRLGEFLRLACRLAMTPPQGPVYVDIPRDFIYELSDYDKWAFDEFIPKMDCYASPDDVAEVLTLLTKSERPVILAGGACVSNETSPLIEEISSISGAPVVTSYAHNDVISNDYELFLGALGRGGSEAAMKVYSKADLVLALGTRMDDFTFIPFYGFEYGRPNAKIVQVSINAADIGRSRKVDLGIVADVTSFSGQLLKSLRSKEKRTLENYRREVKEEKMAWHKQIASTKATTDLPIMNEVYFALRKVLPKDAIVSVDVGSSPSLAYSLLEYQGPRTLLSPSPLGGLGFSIPAAIGAKIAKPEKTVFALIGDGAFTMEISALITAIEYRIPINVLVFDNSAWGSEKNYQKLFYNSRYVGSDLVNPDLGNLASSLGANAGTIHLRSELEGTMRDTFSREAVNVLIVKIDPETFPPPARRDAVHTPVRGIFKPLP